MTELRGSRLSFYKLEIYKRVVELGSVTKVAEELYISQPVVSEHLRALEAQFGAKLFNWEGRHLRLTAVGEVVYDLASGVLTRTSEAMRMVEGIASGDEGTVVVGSTATMATYRLPGLLLPIVDRAPKIRITLETFPSASILPALLDGQCDFAVVMEGSAIPGAQVTSQALGSEPLLLVAAPSYGVPDQLSYADLERYQFVCSPRSQARRMALDEMLRARGVGPRRVRVELSHPEAIKQGVLAELGVAFLYRCAVAAELASGALVEVALPGPPMWTGVALWHRQGRRFSPAQHQVMDVLRDGFAAGLGRSGAPDSDLQGKAADDDDPAEQ